MSPFSPCIDSSLPLHHYYHNQVLKSPPMGAQPHVLYTCQKPCCLSRGTPQRKHENNHINPKTKTLKPNFIADQKDTCENFQFSTDQEDSYSGIFPIALLYLFDNLRMLLNWLLPDLTIPKALTLTCFGNMVGVQQEHFEVFLYRLPLNDISAFTDIYFHYIILVRQ